MDEIKQNKIKKIMKVGKVLDSKTEFNKKQILNLKKRTLRANLSNLPPDCSGQLFSFNDIEPRLFDSLYK